MGVVDYYRVDVRHVDAGFHDHGAEKDVVFSFHEIFDHFLEFVFRHLPVADGYPDVGKKFFKTFSFLFYRLNSVVKIEDLTVAQELPLDRFLDYGAALFYERRLDGQTVLGGSVDDRHVP